MIAVVSGVAYLSLSWKETADFDVIGFLWVLRNFPKLAAAVTFWLSVVGALGSLLDAWLRK